MADGRGESNTKNEICKDMQGLCIRGQLIHVGVAQACTPVKQERSRASLAPSTLGPPAAAALCPTARARRASSGRQGGPARHVPPAPTRRMRARPPRALRALLPGSGRPQRASMLRSISHHDAPVCTNLSLDIHRCTRILHRITSHVDFKAQKIKK